MTEPTTAAGRALLDLWIADTEVPQLDWLRLKQHILAIEAEVRQQDGSALRTTLIAMTDSIIYDIADDGVPGPYESKLREFRRALAALPPSAPPARITPPGIDPATGMRYSPGDDPMVPHLPSCKNQTALESGHERCQCRCHDDDDDDLLPPSAPPGLDDPAIKRIEKERSRRFDGQWTGETTFYRCECGGNILAERWESHRAEYARLQEQDR